MSADNQIEVRWLSGPMAPDAVLEFLACNCKNECKLPKCQCLANGLKCTDACSTNTCSNMIVDEEDEIQNLEAETSDDDDADKND